MTYKDDLKKLREEAGISGDDPSMSGSPSSSRPSVEKDTSEDQKLVDAFTKEEKKLSWWQKIALPFVRSSFMSAMAFALVTLVYIAISHTVVSAMRDISRSTILIFIVKDSIYAILLSVIMYRVFTAQFANTYHLKQEMEKQTETSKEWEAIQRSMMEAIPDTLVYTLDTNLCYTSFNNRHKYSMLRMWHQEIAIGNPVLDFIEDPEVREKTKKNLEQALSGEYISDTDKFGDNDLTATYWKTYYSPILSEDRKILGVSCYITNITSLKQSQNKNLFLSYHDPLTKLYNRVYCEDVFAQAEREDILPYSLIVADIHGMHRINDNYGRQTGDNLLIKVGEIMTKAIKENGYVARWGSDEFIVLLPHTDTATAEALANICKLEFSGVTVNGIPLKVHTGFATRTASGQTLQDVLSSAEAHLSEAVK